MVEATIRPSAAGRAFESPLRRCRETPTLHARLSPRGEVAERLKAAVSKTDTDPLLQAKGGRCDAIRDAILRNQM